MDYLEIVSRYIVLAAFAITIICFVAAPLLAIGWQQKPFPGFLIDQTLVVNSMRGKDWGPHVTGIDYPERVTRVAGDRVSTARQFDRVMATFEVGDRVQIFTGTRTGMGKLYPGIRMMAFPIADFLRLFWLPYFVGLAYLAIGVWIYRLRGSTRPGRALSFFCVVTAAVNGLFFDVSTTHAMSLIWTLAMAQAGGALISLALRFPEEWFPVRFQPAILALPYLVSIALSVWGFLTLYDLTRPWAYVPMWEACQRYAGLGSVVFLCVMIYRAFAGHDATVRRQARLMVVGSILAFFPVTFWFIAPLFNMNIAFDPVLFLPSLIFFPLSIALAILRFRLWDIDEFVNYAFVYGASTAILAGVFTALTALTQRLFVLTTGAKSDAAIVLVTLIIATAFTPLRARVQKFVDRYLSDAARNVGELRAFGSEVQTFLQMQDVTLLTRRLLKETIDALDAESGMLSVLVNGRLQPLHVIGQWKDKVALSVPLEVGGQRYGLLQIGPHLEDRAYTDAEGDAVQQVAREVSNAIQLAWPRFLAAQGAERPSADNNQALPPQIDAREQPAHASQPSRT
jgi:hypothetical protein